MASAVAGICIGSMIQNYLKPPGLARAKLHSLNKIDTLPFMYGNWTKRQRPIGRT